MVRVAGWVKFTRKKHRSSHRSTCFCFRSKKWVRVGLGQNFLTRFAMYWNNNFNKIFINMYVWVWMNRMNKRLKIIVGIVPREIVVMNLLLRRLMHLHLGWDQVGSGQVYTHPNFGPIKIGFGRKETDPTQIFKYWVRWLGLFSPSIFFKNLNLCMFRSFPSNLPFKICLSFIIIFKLPYIGRISTHYGNKY